MAPTVVEGSASRRDVRFRTQFRKTEMCRFFQTTGCSRGSACQFAHGEDELQVAPDLTKTSLCRAWQNRKCARPSEACPFAHGCHELRATAAYVSPKKRAPAAERSPTSAATPTADSPHGGWWASPQPAVSLEALVPPVVPAAIALVPVCAVPWEAKTTAVPAVTKATACGAAVCEAGERQPAQPQCLRMMSDVVNWAGVGTGRDLEALLRQAMPDTYED